MSGMAMPGHSMPGMGAPGRPGMDLNDVEYDAFLANDRTLADPQVVRTERNGKVLLRIINGAAATAFWIDLGNTRADVVAVDGNPVKPINDTRFPLATAQRLDLVITVPPGSTVPILAQREGDKAQTGIVLAAPGALVSKIAATANRVAGPVDLSLESRLSATTALPAAKADIVHRVTLSG